MCSDMSRERSPLAMSPRTEVASLTGHAIFSISELIASMATVHDPPASSDARSVVFPSEPTLRFTRLSSLTSASFSSINALKASATSPMTPSATPSVSRRIEKSPCRAARSASRNA